MNWTSRSGEKCTTPPTVKVKILIMQINLRAVWARRTDAGRSAGYIAVSRQMGVVPCILCLLYPEMRVKRAVTRMDAEPSLNSLILRVVRDDPR